VNGLAQVVGPEYVAPPHWPYCATVPVAVDVDAAELDVALDVLTIDEVEDDLTVETVETLETLVDLTDEVGPTAVVVAPELPLQLNTEGPGIV